MAQKEEKENCPQCFYWSPAAENAKKESTDCPQCFYSGPSMKYREPVKECPQCHYIKPSAAKEVAADSPKVPDTPVKASDMTEENCPQCFYTQVGRKEEKKSEGDCPQCFYPPTQEEEVDSCPQCFYKPRVSSAASADTGKKSIKVIVYTMPECGFCNMVKDFLRARGIDFEEVSIPESTEAQNFMESRGYISAPVTVIGGKEIIGAEIAEIKKALGI